MAESSRIQPADFLSALAGLAAIAAAVAMVAVWAPTQIRAFDAATGLSEAPAPSPGVSWTRIPFKTADGRATSISETNGRVRIVTMFYAHCPGACPLSIETLKALGGGLPAAQRERLAIIALTLNPEQDSVTSLKAFRKARGIASGQWIFGRSAAADVAGLAGAIGVSYRVLDDATVDHQSVFVLLDEQGRVLSRTSRTRDIDPQFAAALRSALQRN